MLVDNPDGGGVPERLRPLAREALMEGDNETLAAFFNPHLEDEPLFVQLITREDLDADLRQRVLANLAKTCPEEAVQCPDLEPRLRDLISFSPSTLREDLAPSPVGPQTWIPLYYTYYLTKKLIQGRDLDGMDIAFAAMDALFIYSVVGATGKVATQTLKVGAKQVGATVAKQGGRKAIGGAITSITTLAANGRMMTAITKQYLQPLIAAMSKVNKSADKLTQVDVTQALQWIFQKTGVGRDSMKRLTGLEARVFMRNDARVVIQPSNSKVGTFLSETAQNALSSSAADMSSAWQQHASAWWLANAAGAH
jgi:hypothetical protein